jgi:beta-glucosidase
MTKAKKLVARMTLLEKATFVSGDGWWQTFSFKRLGIPSIWMSDGPHGLRKAVEADVTTSVPATCFPTASCLASSWDPELIHSVGKALGRECQANGVQLLLGPGNNMKRSPLGGRNFEYFSEDPLLAGKMASAHIQGVQSEGVGATLKHFAANNQEFERMTSSSNLDERTLHEIYLRSFEIPVKEAKPTAIMCSYNRINGVLTSEDPWLLTEVLRNQWGYEGFVVSDWGAVRDRVEGIQAGLSLEMPGSGTYNRDRIIQAVKKGVLKTQKLDDAAVKLLAVVLKVWESRKPGAVFNRQEHHQLARLAASESMVLLKNEKHLLPLNTQQKSKVAVIGNFARDPRYQGAGSSQVNPTKLDNAFEELVKTGGDKLKFSFTPGYGVEGDVSPSLLSQALKLARSSDIALLFVGLPDSYESEGFDRTTLDIPKGHQKLIEEIAKVQPNLVVILMNGSAVSMPWLPKAKAVLEAWLGGQAGGGAIADVLLGRANPCGKLGETFPHRLEDTPPYPEFPGMGEKANYGEGIFMGYRHYDKRKIAPLFPFGFGLSYTTFAYSNLKISNQAGKAPSLRVEFSVKNTGRRAGKEIVQVYSQEQNPTLPRPDKELKAFAKVFLKPGETKKVVFKLAESSLGYWDAILHSRRVNPGLYDILVGSSSRHLHLAKSVRLKGDKPSFPPLTGDSLLKRFKDHPKGKAFYQRLLNATGVTEAIQRRPKKSNLSQREITSIEKAEKAMMASVNEIPVNRIGAFSGGHFKDAELEKILKKVL